MRLLKHIFTVLLPLAALCLWSCGADDSPTYSKAVLASASALNFEASATIDKQIIIYADAYWISEAPDWITITPSTGTGVTEVTVAVSDNIRDGRMDNPRKATVVFKGATLASEAKVIVNQVGDKFRDVKDYGVGEIAALEDQTVVSVPEVLVTAITAEGFIVSDAQNTDNVYVLGELSLNIGDVVTILGSKSTDIYSLAVVECDELTVVSTGGTVAYPAPEDITAKVDNYKPDSRKFITVSGILNGNNIVVENAEFSVNIVSPPASMGVPDLNGHRVTATGYFAGFAAPVVRIMLTGITDNGVVKVIYFSDDFEWADEWSVKCGAGDTVANNGDQSAINIFTNAALTSDPSFTNALTEHGYTIIYTGKAAYLQRNYLKFGKTDVQAGIVLPPLDNIPLDTDVILSFDWAPMVGGTRKFDPVEIIVMVVNGSDETNFGPIGHSFVNKVDDLAWLHAEIPLTGASITSATAIVIRSNVWGETAATTGSSVFQRWFLDNIEIFSED